MDSKISESSFELSHEEKELQMRVRRFAVKKLRPVWREIDDVDALSWDLVHMLADEGIMRYCAPEEHGGAGISAMTCSIIREELSRDMIQADDIFLMSWSTGLMISTFGTEEQKKKYLRKLGTGEILGSGAITELGAGSDIKGITTTATLDGDSWILNGQKGFASNAGEAEVTRVLAKTDPSLGGDGFSYFIVDTKNRKPGCTVEFMSICAPHPAYIINFDNYRIPKDSLIGSIGGGLEIALKNLAKTRVTVGGVAVGIAQTAYEEAIKYAHSRIAFRRPLVKFQTTQMKLANMATEIEAGRLLLYSGSKMADRKPNTDRAIMLSSMAKLYCTEMAQRVVDESMQIHGGAGLLKGSRIEYLYRAVRAPRIYEGTSEIQRLTITRHALRQMTAEERGESK